MADTTIVFFGIRLDIPPEEVEALETRTHNIILEAKKAGLQHYWGNFGVQSDRFVLFVGKLLGKFGIEDRTDLEISPEQLGKVVEDITSRLRSAGFAELPSLLVQAQPDV
jgi:hypothetical protein